MRQAPLPLQVPSVPQVALPASIQRFCGSGPPSVTAEQVPSPPGTPHDKQVPVQAVAQQKPCAQIVDAHSPPAVQAAPLGFLPQLVPTHTFPVEHWVLTEQVSRQTSLVAAQTYGAQSRPLPGRHPPVPLQRLGEICRPLAHEPGPHTVPLAYSRQAPLPSQTPVVPQLGAPASGH